MNRNRHALPNGRIKLATRGLSCLFLVGINVDTKNSKRFSDPKVREAVEYAIDKEAICSGPGEGLYKPFRQIVSSDHPDCTPAGPPRKYDPGKAKKLLPEAGFPIRVVNVREWTGNGEKMGQAKKDQMSPASSQVRLVVMGHMGADESRNLLK